MSEASCLRPDSRRTSPWNETVKLSRGSKDCGELSNWVAVRNLVPYMMKPFIMQSLKISVILHSFASALIWCIDIMSFRVFWVTVLVFGCSPSGSTEWHQPRPLVVEQLLYSSDCRGTRRVAQKVANATFWFGNIAPKQLIMLGFPQHTSTNTVYIWNNKTSQQLKVLHMNELFQCVANFSSEFAQEPSYCLNGETTTTAEAHNAYSTLLRLMVYFRYFRTKMRKNVKAHSWTRKILMMHSNTKEN